MKKKLKIIIPTLVLCVLGFLVYNVFAKMKYKEGVEKHLQTIPKFSFKTLENNNFTNIDLDAQAATVFIYFNTECDYCQHETLSISENIDLFKNAQLLFVSTEPVETIKAFANNYNSLNQPKITFLNDNTNTFSARFYANSIPYLLIYNKKQELVKKHKGQLKAEAIAKLLEN